MLEMGRVEEAEAAFRRLARDHPREAWPLQGLWSALQRRDRPHEAFSIIGPMDNWRGGLIAKGLRSLVTLRRLDEARSYFSSLLESARDASVLVILFEILPELFEGWPRTKMWLALAQKVDHIASGQCAAASTLSTLKLRLMLALRNYDSFRVGFEAISDTRSFGVHEANLRAVAAALRRSPFPDYEKQRIFGIGLSKTGTTSLAKALATLGFAAIHWTNPLTGELISEDDLALFDAFNDTPCCMNFERYYYSFPNSKFIYTVRQQNDWEKSWSCPSSNAIFAIRLRGN